MCLRSPLAILQRGLVTTDDDRAVSETNDSVIPKQSNSLLVSFPFYFHAKASGSITQKPHVVAGKILQVFPFELNLNHVRRLSPKMCMKLLITLRQLPLHLLTLL